MGSVLKPDVSTQASAPHSVDGISEEDPVTVTIEGKPQFIGFFRFYTPSNQMYYRYFRGNPNLH